MKSNELFAIVAAAALIFWPQIKGYIPGGVQPGPAPAPVAVPDATAQAAVAPVSAVLKGNADAKAKFGAYFTMLAKAIQVAPDHFKTVGDLQAHQQLAGSLYMQQVPGGVSGLGEAVAASYKTLLGDDNKALPQADALRAVNALAWACNQ